MADDRRVIHAAAVGQRRGTELRSRRIGIVTDVREKLETSQRRILVAGVDVRADQPSLGPRLGAIEPDGGGRRTGLLHPELVV
jgi:hypothetical protein